VKSLPRRKRKHPTKSQVLVQRLTCESSAAEKHAHNTDAYKVDVDKYPTAKAYFKITAAPTVVVFKDGEEIAKEEGMDQEKAKKIASVLV